MHEDRLASYGSVCEDSPVRGDTRDAEAGTDLVADLIGQIDSLFRRNHGELSRGAERSVGLRPVQPHAPTDPTGVNTWSNRVDDPGTVAVRDDARIGHLRAQPASSFLGITRVHSGEPNSDTHVALTRLGRWQVADLQHLTGRTLPLVPDGAHKTPWIPLATRVTCPEANGLTAVVPGVAHAYRRARTSSFDRDPRGRYPSWSRRRVR